MRIRSQAQVDITSLINQGNPVSIDALRMQEEEGDGTTLSLFLISPDPPEDPNDIVYAEAFSILTPGFERTVLVLKSDGYNHATISQIIGMPAEQIELVVTNAKQKLIQKLHLS